MNTSSSSGGLVRRTNAAKSSSSDFNTSSTSTNNDHNDNFKNGSEDENLEETSDKETRLTLMEEVLLLGLKDKEVRIHIHKLSVFPKKNNQVLSEFNESSCKVHGTVINIQSHTRN